MRGQDTQQSGIFRYLFPGAPAPATHPLRFIREFMDTA